MQWSQFRTQDELDYSPAKLYGSLGVYDANGYYQWFAPYNTTLRAFQGNLTKMKNEGYYDLSTIAKLIQNLKFRFIEVSLTLYNTRFDYYISVVLLIEQSAGNIFPSRAVILPYRLNPFKSGNKGLQAVDVFRILLQVYIMYIIIIKLCAYGSIENILSTQSLVNVGQNLIIIVFQFISFVLPIQEQAGYDLKPEDFMTQETNNSFFYTNNMAFWFNQAFILEALSLLFILYKMICVFRIYRGVQIILESLETASLLVGTFVSFICVLFVGMTIVAMNIWGPHIIQFKNFSDAFLSVIFLQMGLVDFEQLRSYSMVWSFVFMIVYCIFIIYVLLSSFMIIFIDSYRRVVIQEGALSQNQKQLGVQNSQEMRSFTSFMKWFFGWLPNECLKKIGKNDEVNDNMGGDEDEDIIDQNGGGQGVSGKQGLINDSSEEYSDDDKKS